MNWARAWKRLARAERTRHRHMSAAGAAAWWEREKVRDALTEAEDTLARLFEEIDALRAEVERLTDRVRALEGALTVAGQALEAVHIYTASAISDVPCAMTLPMQSLNAIVRAPLATIREALGPPKEGT